MSAVELIEQARHVLRGAQAEHATRARALHDAQAELRRLQAQREQAARHGGPQATAELRERIREVAEQVEDLAAFAKAAEAPIGGAQRALAEAIEASRPALAEIAAQASAVVERERAAAVEALRTLEAAEAEAEKAWRTALEGRDTRRRSPLWEGVLAASDAELRDDLRARVGNLDADARLPGRSVADLMRVGGEPVRISGRQLAELPWEGWRARDLARALAEHYGSAPALPQARLPLPSDQGEPGVYVSTVSGATRVVDAVEAREHRDRLLPDSCGFVAWRFARPLSAAEAERMRAQRATLGDGQIIPGWNGQQPIGDRLDARRGVELKPEDPNAPEPFLAWID